MAVYKVPQDVEADDKLIGPFSFRQFIYLIVVAISMAGAWGLSQLFIPLVIIPLPIIVFFAALALPLRKDQPMEAYLSAVVSFYFMKSRKRFWVPDGITSFVTIIPPKDADKILTKELDETEATKRLEYLSQLVDTHGWAIRGAGGTPDTSISTDLYFEARNSVKTPDMMDSTTPEAKKLTEHLDNEAGDKKQEAIDNMKAAAKEVPKTAPTPKKAADADTPPVSKLPTVEEAMAKQELKNKELAAKASRDAVALANAMIEEASESRGVPAAKTPVERPANTSVSTPDTGTMELTREQTDELLDTEGENIELKVSTVAGLAKHKAEENKSLKDGEEVTISFR
jgi:hypothetical protein